MPISAKFFTNFLIWKKKSWDPSGFMKKLFFSTHPNSGRFPKSSLLLISSLLFRGTKRAPPQPTLFSLIRPKTHDIKLRLPPEWTSHPSGVILCYTLDVGWVLQIKLHVYHMLSEVRYDLILCYTRDLVEC